MRGINKIGPDELATFDGFGNFQALTASTIGNEISDTDGWDEDINTVASAMAEDFTSFGALDDLLTASGFVPDALDAAVLLPLASDHATLTAVGDPLLDDLAQSIGAAPGENPPPPDTNPPPGDNGGPGGGPGNPGTGNDGGPQPGGTGAPSIICILFDHANSPPTESCTIEGGNIGGGIHPPLQE